MNIKLLTPRILIYEGIPGSGKTTLRYNYGTETNFEDLTIDRFTPTRWVFAQHRQDKDDLHTQEVESLLDSTFEVRVVRCICDPEIALERALKRGDELDLTLDMMKRLSDLYDRYFNEICEFRIVHNVNTGILNEQQSVEELGRLVKEDQAHFYEWERLR